MNTSSFSFTRASKGFTLLETVVVVGLSAIMFCAVALLVRSFYNSYSSGQSSSLSAQSVRSVMQEAESLTFVADHVLQSHVFPGSVTYTSSPTVLVLEIPSIDSSGNSIANTYDYAAFYISGTKAYRLLAANAASKRVSGTKQLSTTISSLTFSYDSSDWTLVSTITVDVQTSVQSGGHSSTDHRYEQMRLRNI